MLLFKEDRKACIETKYFQNKLALNFEDELIRYKKIYNNLNLKDRKNIRGYFYDSHKKWEESMTEHIEKLTNEDLQEFYFWIENQKNLTESGTQMINAFLLAFIAAGFANMLADVLGLSLGDNVIDIVVSIILWVFRYATLIVVLCCFIRYVFYKIFHVNVQKQFYRELTAIVKRVIKKRKMKMSYL